MRSLHGWICNLCLLLRGIDRFAKQTRSASPRQGQKVFSADDTSMFKTDLQQKATPTPHPPLTRSPFSHRRRLALSRRRQHTRFAHVLFPLSRRRQHTRFAHVLFPLSRRRQHTRFAHVLFPLSRRRQHTRFAHVLFPPCLGDANTRALRMCYFPTGEGFLCKKQVNF